MQDDANRGELISDFLEDEGAQFLDLMLSVMEEKDKLKQDILTLGNAFIEDFQERITQVDTQYLIGPKIIYSISGHSYKHRTSSLCCS